MFLKDAECTRARLARELSALLARTREGDLVIFYYPGHGSQGDDGGGGFAPHDGDGGAAPSTTLTRPARGLVWGSVGAVSFEKTQIKERESERGNNVPPFAFID